MPRIIDPNAPEKTAPETSWRGQIMRKWWWFLFRPFVNLFLAILALFLWDPGD